MKANKMYVVRVTTSKDESHGNINYLKYNGYGTVTMMLDDELYLCSELGEKLDDVSIIGSYDLYSNVCSKCGAKFEEEDSISFTATVKASIDKNGNIKLNVPTLNKLENFICNSCDTGFYNQEIQVNNVSFKEYKKTKTMQNKPDFRGEYATYLHHILNWHGDGNEYITKYKLEDIPKLAMSLVVQGYLYDEINGEDISLDEVNSVINFASHICGKELDTLEYLDNYDDRIWYDLLERFGMYCDYTHVNASYLELNVSILLSLIVNRLYLDAPNAKEEISLNIDTLYKNKEDFEKYYDKEEALKDELIVIDLPTGQYVLAKILYS